MHRENPTTKSPDRMLLTLVGLLVIVGAAFFVSASLGLLARDSGPSFSTLAVKQLLIGLCIGGTILFACSHVQTTYWRRSGFFIYIIGLVLCLTVFIPGLGFSHGGAHRWIIIFGQSFQPAELLKFGVILYVAALLVSVGKKIRTLKTSAVVLSAALIPSLIVLFLQPDLSTAAVIICAVMAMYIVAGARISHIIFIGGMGILIALLAMLSKPYALERIGTFLNPSADPSGAGYQINQSLTAIGAGGIIGRGFGQSIQKFKYLPEPVGDSIFAVIGEEFGLIGTSGLIILFLLFVGRSFTIASRTPDHYGRLVIVGIVILVITESFFNMASMLGLVPLSGMPLVFVSQGGTALIFALAQVGIILSVSKTITPSHLN